LADRYCRNCGNELAEDDRFCSNCGRAVHESAHVPTPEADRPVRRIPPAAERDASERLRYGTLDAPTQSRYQRHGPGVWSGVKVFFGGCIVLPIIIILFLVLMLSGGGS
jgi:hypothetical protein